MHPTSRLAPIFSAKRQPRYSPSAGLRHLALHVRLPPKNWSVPLLPSSLLPPATPPNSGAAMSRRPQRPSPHRRLGRTNPRSCFLPLSAHNNRVSLGPKDIRTLAELISSEKRVVERCVPSPRRSSIPDGWGWRAGNRCKGVSADSHCPTMDAIGVGGGRLAGE